MSYQLYIVTGKLGSDPKVFDSKREEGSQFCTFSVATDEPAGKKDGKMQYRTEWHDVVAYDHNAAWAIKNLKKGSAVTVIGRMKSDSYQSDKYKDAEGNPAPMQRKRLVADRVEGMGSHIAADNANGSDVSEKSTVANTAIPW